MFPNRKLRVPLEWPELTVCCPTSLDPERAGGERQVSGNQLGIGLLGQGL
jgi:hypothetical protein